MTALPSALAEKVGKILPRLASDHDAEVLATVAAIRRTLAAAGLDLNDLGQHVGNTGVPDLSTYTAPDWPEAERKAQEPPPRCPTFSTMRHHQRCEWLLLAETMNQVLGLVIGHKEFADLKTKVLNRPHEFLTRAETKLFNRLVNAAWNAGARWQTETS